MVLTSFKLCITTPKLSCNSLIFSVVTFILSVDVVVFFIKFSWCNVSIFIFSIELVNVSTISEFLAEIISIVDFNLSISSLVPIFIASFIACIDSSINFILDCSCWVWILVITASSFCIVGCKLEFKAKAVEAFVSDKLLAKLVSILATNTPKSSVNLAKFSCILISNFLPISSAKSVANFSIDKVCFLSSISNSFNTSLSLLFGTILSNISHNLSHFFIVTSIDIFSIKVNITDNNIPYKLVLNETLTPLNRFDIPLFIAWAFPISSPLIPCIIPKNVPNIPTPVKAWVI